MNKWLTETEYEEELAFEKEIREESGADDGKLHPEDPDICPECGGTMRLVWDSNYGADADGRRGMCIEWMECKSCEYVPEGG